MFWHTWLTFPNTSEPTNLGSTLLSSRAAFAAISWSLLAETPLSFPPNVPKAVLFAATMKTPDTPVLNKTEEKHKTMTVSLQAPHRALV